MFFVLFFGVHEVNRNVFLLQCQALQMSSSSRYQSEFCWSIECFYATFLRICLLKTLQAGWNQIAFCDSVQNTRENVREGGFHAQLNSSPQADELLSSFNDSEIKSPSLCWSVSFKQMQDVLFAVEA